MGFFSSLLMNVGADWHGPAAQLPVQEIHGGAICLQPFHRIAIMVVAHIMPAEEHLAWRPAVGEDHRRHSTVSILRSEQLPVNLTPVGRLESYLFGCHELACRKIGWERLRPRGSSLPLH